jgi:hypothetical protein
VFDWVIGVCVAILPVAVGAAVPRYRLYDLDRIVSRTLAYGLLSVVLGGCYAVVALLAGGLLGRDSSLAVAAATLAAAALFRPARRRPDHPGPSWPRTGPRDPRGCWPGRAR